jgi:hypothetical protein
MSRRRHQEKRRHEATPMPGTGAVKRMRDRLEGSSLNEFIATACRAKISLARAQSSSCDLPAARNFARSAT